MQRIIMVTVILMVAACGAQQPQPTVDPIIPVESPDITQPPALLTPAVRAEGSAGEAPVNEGASASDIERDFTINVTGVRGNVGTMFASSTCTERGLRVTWMNDATSSVEVGTLETTLYFVIPPNTTPDSYTVSRQVQNATAELLGGAEVNTANGVSYSTIVDGSVALNHVPAGAGDTLSGRYELTLGNAVPDTDAELDVRGNVVTISGMFDYDVSTPCT